MKVIRHVDYTFAEGENRDPDSVGVSQGDEEIEVGSRHPEDQRTKEFGSGASSGNVLALVISRESEQERNGGTVLWSLKRSDGLNWLDGRCDPSASWAQSRAFLYVHTPKRKLSPNVSCSSCSSTLHTSQYTPTPRTPTPLE